MGKYDYKGALEPVTVKVVIFHTMPDYIFSLEQWTDEGGWRGLIKAGAFNISDVKEVVTGTMNPERFNALPAWEG